MRKMKAMTVKMETVTLIDKGRQNLTCLVYKCMKLIIQYFFLADILFLGVALGFNKYILPSQMCFFGKSSQISVILQLGKYSNYAMSLTDIWHSGCHRSQHGDLSVCETTHRGRPYYF